MSLILLIDAGNTRIKWALAESQSSAKVWHESGSITLADAEDVVSFWCGMQVSHVLISNVAGTLVREELQALLVRAFEGRMPQVEWFVSSQQRGGLHNTYRDPSQLGCDRFAGAIGAHALYPDRALIVATCGTATTIDAIEGDRFVGGMIVPGLALMASSLAAHTAQLPQIALQASTATPFADNTDAAILSGCLAAQVGAIERAVAELRRRRGADVTCILSGGAADLIAPQLSMAHERVDNLVLIGLHTVATSC